MDQLKSYHDFISRITPKLNHADLLSTNPMYKHSIPAAVFIIYILMLLFLPRMQMKFRFFQKPGSVAFKLFKKFVAFWNLFLCIYSGISFSYYFSAFFVDFLPTFGNFANAQCDNACYLWENKHPNIFWMEIWAWSKHFEIIDTFILIIKNPKRKVKFIHWFHHGIMLLLTWYSVSYRLSLTLYAISVNNFIHFVMYCYFFLHSISLPQKWGIVLTFLQVVQMFLGFTSMIYFYYHHFILKKNCCCDNLTAVLPVYTMTSTTFVFLFTSFMIKKYFGKKPKRKM